MEEREFFGRHREFYSGSREASRDGRTGLQARARNDIGRDRAFAYLIKVFRQAGSRSRPPDGRKSDHPAASLAYAGSRIALG